MKLLNVTNNTGHFNTEVPKLYIKESLRDVLKLKDKLITDKFSLEVYEYENLILGFLEVKNDKLDIIINDINDEHLLTYSWKHLEDVLSEKDIEIEELDEVVTMIETLNSESGGDYER